MNTVAVTRVAAPFRNSRTAFAALDNALGDLHHCDHHGLPAARPPRRGLPPPVEVLRLNIALSGLRSL
jgi:hypothetical protein